ncbi:MAG: hypothetical protein IJQ81_01390, partial [Oscillibacter sp.]|nr:hypothetical protein [Oscillibacter sp.]
CDEGVLEWIDKRNLLTLPMWAGDALFLRLLEDNAPFFSLKLRYEGERLAYAALNGKPLDVREALENAWKSPEARRVSADTGKD